MNINQLPALKVETLTCSAVLVQPKPPFFEWLNKIHEGKIRLEDIYFPEEDPVWLIPPTSHFSSHELFDEYVKYLKPKLLENYLGGFARVEQMPSLDGETFDGFLDLVFRDSVRNTEDFLSS